MPYYRVIIWVKQYQVLNATQGIRLIESMDIELVYRQMWGKAIEHYGEHLVHDVEVQMLSMSCSAVKAYLELMQKKKTASLPILKRNRKATRGEKLTDKINKREGGDERA